MVIYLNIRNAIKDFLYDQNYFITMYNENIFIYGYKEIESLTNKTVKLKIDNFILKIDGNNLKVTKMNNSELFINGIINNIGKIYE